MNDSAGFLYQHLPWNFITKFHVGVVLQKDGIMQRTFAYRAPDIDSSNAIEVNFLALRVNDFAKRLGSGWAFHMEAQRFQMREYPDATFDMPGPYLIDRERAQAFRAAGRHFDSSYFLTVTWRQPFESVKKLTALFVQGASSGEGAGIKHNVDFFVNETNAVVSLLANSIMLNPLDNEQTIAYLHSSVSFNRHPIRFPHTQILLDRILPDEELETSLTMKLGGKYIPIVGVNDFPEESYPAILDDLNRARLEYRWVTRYICLDKEEGKREAQKKEKAHRGSRKTFLQTFAETTSGEPSRALNHGAGVKESDAIDAGIEIETDQAALGFMTTSVMVWDASLQHALKKAELVKTIINSKGFTCKDERFSAFEAWKAMMPGQIYAHFRALPVMTNTLAHVVPLSSVWAGTSVNEHAEHITGVNIPHIMCSTLEGTPFFLNLNVGDVGHAAVWGPTGAGKSTLLNLLETQVFKYPGAQVIVFDKGRSCRQPCLACGGLFYEPAGENSAGVTLQPLRDLDTDRDVMDAIDFIETCITVNGESVTPPIRAAIKASIEHLRELEPARRTLTSFIHYCDYMDQLTRRPVIKELLGDYLVDGGKYGKIFDSRGSGMRLDAPFIAFEMETLMGRGETCVAPALVYLFNLVEKKFDGRLTLLILDEAWLFLRNPAFADKIAEWLKVLRKKNVYVIFATQDVADVARSPLKTTIIQQCLTKIYLADPSALTSGMMSVYSEFGLSDTEISLIATATMKRDYFYTSPAGRRLFQLDLGTVTLGLIGGADHDLLDELLARFGAGVPLAAEILDRKGIHFQGLLDEHAPDTSVPLSAADAPLAIQAAADEAVTPEPGTDVTVRATAAPAKINELLDALEEIPSRKKADGAGRAADAIARRFAVSPSTVYQARRVLQYGGTELVDALRRGEIPIKTAYKRLPKNMARELPGIANEQT